MAKKAATAKEVEKPAEEIVAETGTEQQAKKGLTYAQTLEARAQRGSMTHQKRFAMQQVKKKEMKGE